MNAPRPWWFYTWLVCGVGVYVFGVGMVTGEHQWGTGHSGAGGWVAVSGVASLVIPYVPVKVYLATQDRGRKQATDGK